MNRPTLADEARAAGIAPITLYMRRYRAKRAAERPQPPEPMPPDVVATLDVSRRSCRLSCRALSVAVGKRHGWWTSILAGEQRLMPDDHARVVEHLRSLVLMAGKAVP